MFRRRCSLRSDWPRRVVRVALVMVMVALAGCGREEAPTRGALPEDSGGLVLAFRTASPSPAAPTLGPVDTIRVALLDPFGDPVAPEVILPIGRSQTTFQAALEAPAFASLEAVA